MVPSDTEIAPSMAPKKRSVTCSTCKMSGHMAKTCLSATAASASGGGAAVSTSSSELPQTTENKSKRKLDKKAKKRSEKTKENAEGFENDSVLSSDGSSDGDNCAFGGDSKAFDGGDGDNSDDEGDGSMANPIDLTWEKADIPSLPEVQTRGSSEPKKESIDEVIPPFTSRRTPGSRISEMNRLLLATGKSLITTVLDFFMLFFSTAVLTAFVNATNDHGRNNTVQKKRHWKDVTVEEFKTFLGIVLHLGIVKYPSRGMAWRKDNKYGSPWVRSMMFQERFEVILKNWRWVDTSLLTDAERKQKNKENCFWTVESFLDGLSATFLSCYNPHQKANIDEGCFPFKGRHKARCYNPSKPWKWHFKSFCLNCAITGYMMCFFMYQGRDEKRPDGQTATEYPVLRLLSDPIFHHIGMIIATDNWYTSIALALKLLEIGIYLFGTARTNKQGIPKDSVFKKTGRSKKERGEMSCEKTHVTVAEKSFFLYFISWMDNKPVHLISTFFTKFSQVKRAVKEKMTYIGHQLIRIPTLVQIYNACMGGTDYFDQLCSYYRTTVKTKVWQTRIFTHFLMAAAVNAHILYKLENNLKRGDKGFELLDFLGILVDQLCTPRVEKTATDPDYPKRFDGKLHLPMFYQNALKPDGKQRENRKPCINKCGNRTGEYCRTCGVHLCFDGCWEAWHTQKK